MSIVNRRQQALWPTSSPTFATLKLGTQPITLAPGSSSAAHTVSMPAISADVSVITTAVESKSGQTITGGLTVTTLTAGSVTAASGAISSDTMNTNVLTLKNPTNQLVLSHNGGFATTLTSPAPAAARVVTLPDVGGDSSLLTDLSVPALSLLPGWTTTRATVASSAVGSNDVYTVPTGKRAIILGTGTYNPNVATVAVFVEIKTVGGTYIRAGGNIVAAVSGRAAINPNYIFEAGETLSVNTASTTCVIVAGIILFPNTVPLRSYRVQPSLTPQTLFTATTNTFGITNFSPITTSSIQITYVNGTGGTLSLTETWTPNGGSGIVVTAVPTGTITAIGTSLGAIFNTGDTLVVTSSSNTATQLAFITVWEPTVSFYAPEEMKATPMAVGVLVARPEAKAATAAAPRVDGEDEYEFVANRKSGRWWG